jgi:glutamate synthase domain-containing protein 3
VVLGSTGRNFGAGMTGGKAYVLDIAGDFERRYNPEYVSLHRVEADDDVRELQAMIYRHLELTNSTRACDILADWVQYQSMFWKVVPVQTGVPLVVRETMLEPTAADPAKV